MDVTPFPAPDVFDALLHLVYRGQLQLATEMGAKPQRGHFNGRHVHKSMVKPRKGEPEDAGMNHVTVELHAVCFRLQPLVILGGRKGKDGV